MSDLDDLPVIDRPYCTDCDTALDWDEFEESVLTCPTCGLQYDGMAFFPVEVDADCREDW